MMLQWSTQCVIYMCLPIVICGWFCLAFCQTELIILQCITQRRVGLCREWGIALLCWLCGALQHTCTRSVIPCQTQEVIPPSAPRFLVVTSHGYSHRRSDVRRILLRFRSSIISVQSNPIDVNWVFHGPTMFVSGSDINLTCIWPLSVQPWSTQCHI